MVAPQAVEGEAEEWPDCREEQGVFGVRPVETAQVDRSLGGLRRGRCPGPGVGWILRRLAVEDPDVAPLSGSDDDVALRVDVVRLGVAPVSADFLQLVRARLQVAEVDD